MSDMCPKCGATGSIWWMRPGNRPTSSPCPECISVAKTHYPPAAIPDPAVEAALTVAYPHTWPVGFTMRDQFEMRADAHDMLLAALPHLVGERDARIGEWATLAYRRKQELAERAAEIARFKLILRDVLDDPYSYEIRRLARAALETNQ
jgi:hypothetical protein